MDIPNIKIQLIIKLGCIGCKIQQNILREFIHKYPTITLEVLNFLEFDNVAIFRFPTTIISYSGNTIIREGTMPISELEDDIKKLIDSIH